jgi:hypothetical protein
MQPKHLALVLLVLNFSACAKDRADDDQSSESAERGNDDTSEQDASGGSMSRSDAGSSRSDGGGRNASCPGARPSESTVCETTSLCTYDEIECRCSSGLWSCEEPVNPDCPSSTPANDSTCELPEATECDYLDQECECLSGKWSCESEDEEEPLDGSVADGSAADAGTDAARDAGSCPQARPAERTSCTRSTATCTYEDTQCMCPSGMWTCNEPVTMGCPATAPLHGDSCSGRADCDFLEVECECLRGAWNCKKND